jgi:alkanesulfonate monooxygenase SsuD/methylene tetrahydromethanopterin reductase-like flavin-dependent oxidoreductase (luciferase family)
MNERIMEETMKFGLDVPTTGAYADMRAQAALAVEAEAAGWDGFFVWDVPNGIDPWLALTTIALQTTHIKIGLLVLPLARHRPWLVAKRLADLDQFSDGRVTCTVGLGDRDSAFSSYGEESDPIIRARKLDEGLAILMGLWTTDPFSFTGEYYQLHQVSLSSHPIQSPRIPLWIVGGWPRRPPFRRAAKFDGICFKSIHHETRKWLTLEEFQDGLAYVRAHRKQDTPFDVIMSGETPQDRQQGSDIVTPFQEAGATWWIEEGLGWTLEEFRARVRSGPPRR